MLQTARRLFTHLFGARGPADPRVELTEDGFLVIRRGEIWVRVRWSDLEDVFAFKQDRFVVDEILLQFRVRGAKTVFTVSEELVGYNEFVARMQQEFPEHNKGWWRQVAFPAFATNPTLVWVRPPNELDPLARALSDHPEDQTLWLVYADYLEEQGDPRATYIRKCPVLLRPWRWVIGDGNSLVAELGRETSKGHRLHERPAVAIAERTDTDDVLFLIRDTPALAASHLTWRGTVEVHSRLPATTFFASWEEFAEERMQPDHEKTPLTE
jgi:uncharacterized protein (TIGR02996 family)